MGRGLIVITEEEKWWDVMAGGRWGGGGAGKAWYSVSNGRESLERGWGGLTGTKDCNGSVTIVREGGGM